MSLRILIAPDKFKGTLTAHEVAGAICNGWWRHRSQDVFDVLPMSDGGDGFGEIIGQLIGAEPKYTATVDAANRPIDAAWWLSESQGIAVVEAARINGLAQLPPKRFHPFELDTRGLGPVLQDVCRARAAVCYIGIGGSATNDAGFGLARSLGWTFLDSNARPIERWVQLNQLARVLPPEHPLGGCQFVVAVDVQNPLLGIEGCSRVYGPQKGLLIQQMPMAEAALQRLSKVVEDTTGAAYAMEPGSGAAGGLGYGLRTFIEASMESGFEIFARLANLDDRIRQADLVITGEGALDKQSLMGKGTGQMAERCRRHERRCIGLAGMVEGPVAAQTTDRLFYLARGLTPGLTTPQEAKANAALWLERLAAQIAAEYEP